MGTIRPAAPIDGAAVLPDALIEQYVKPAVEQAALVAALRLTAIDWVEGHTGRSLQRRLWTATFDGFAGPLRLPREPVRGVVSVGYVDPAGVAVAAAGWWQMIGDRVAPLTGTRWPATIAAPGAVTVSFEAGYDSVATEAPALQIAALMLTKHLFDGGSVDDVPGTVTLLLDAQYRTPVIAA